MSPRRKSIINFGRVPRQEQDRDGSAALELERLEQETTLVLQEIDHNLSRANAVINEKMFPVLKKYAAATCKVWENVGFWKHFMEEAADVEVKTSNEVLEPERSAENARNEKLSKTENDFEKGSRPEPASDDSSHLLGQIQASTPQQTRPRSLLLSSHSANTRRPLSMHRRLPSSLNKSTPLRGQSESEARRLSLILKHLNSSPTLPEPPVLMSEIGKMNVGSSSSATKASPIQQSKLPSKSDDVSLQRHLPVLLPPISLTPVAAKLAAHRERSAQRFPNTPVFGSSSLRRNADRGSLASPIRRGLPPANEQDTHVLDIPLKISTLSEKRGDESDEIVAPQLLSLRERTGKRERPSDRESVSKKRKILNDDHENIFLEQSDVDKSSSAVYHTMMQTSIQEHGKVSEANSKSISQNFEKALLAGPSEEPSNSPERERGPEVPETVIQDSVRKKAKTGSHETGGKESDANTRPETLENLSQIVNSFENITNSSEMDSFFKERLRSLTRTFRE